MENIKIAGIVEIDLKVHSDSRGYFMETYQLLRHAQAGITGPFVQDNISMSFCGVLRGLHYQINHPQGKLVTVLQGKVFDVVVDLRQSSATFGHWMGITLSADNGKQLWVPPGFAHGFLALEDNTLFSYKCTDYYHPTAERTLLWNDPEIGIVWPLDGKAPVISEKDARGTLFADAEVYR